MTTKVKEIKGYSDLTGDRNACPICNPRSDRIREDQVWAWSQAHPNENPFKKKPS